MTSAGTGLLDEARRDPASALTRGRELLLFLAESDHGERSLTLRAMSIAARNAATMQESLALGEEAVTEGRLAGDSSLEAEAMTTLAGSQAISGDTDLALDTLASAAMFAPRPVLAGIQFQRAVILSTRGEVEPALLAYSEALPVLEENKDRVRVAMTMHNRGLLYVLTGHLDAAEADLVGAHRLHSEDGHLHLLSGVEHNLGLLAAHRGDIPSTLERFAESERLESDGSGTSTTVHASRCEVLLSAGLYREALQLATSIYESLSERGLVEDEAEARLVAAQAAFLAGDTNLAEQLAHSAARMFERQRRPIWVANAKRVVIHARFAQQQLDDELLATAGEIADVLESGLAIASWDARLMAGLIAIDLDRLDLAAQNLERVARIDTGPVELRMQAKLARARLQLALGDRAGAMAAANAGMRLLDHYQSVVGASDIRLGMEQHAAALGETGLQLAIEAGRARRVYAWMERTHANALRFKPVVPSDDKAQVTELAQLRKLTVELRSAGPEEATAVTRDISALQDSIRTRARHSRGPGVVDNPDGPKQLADHLEDHSLVEMDTVDGTIWGVVVTKGRFRLVELGSEQQAIEEADSLRFQMRRLARGRGSPEVAHEIARRLDQLLLAPFRLHDEPLVIVPTPGLHALPWRALPSLQSRPFMVSPSAGLWLRAQQQMAPMPGQLLVAGPDLELSDEEVNRLARLYPQAEVVSSGSSSVGVVLASLDGAGMAHIASHASFQFENPMFSSLRLADGDLNVYDLERLGSVPRLVVLSACDSGFTDTRPGEELMGLSSALLSMGASSIIASVGLVPDSVATKDLMVEMHRGLVAGSSPSVALHQAQMAVSGTPEGFVAASSFVCIGAG